LNEPSTGRSADLHALFYSDEAHRRWFVLGVCLLLVVGEASVMFHSAQREGLPRRIKEIDRI
jgi:hypothetical protein